MTDLAVSGPALRFVAGALLTLACHERNASESVALPSANAAAPRVLASASAARAPNPPRAELDLNAQVAALRDSLLKKDREVFARALAYPVRVNTRSRCWVLLTDAPAFLRHFDEIVSPAVERAIRDAKPDSSSAKSYRQGLGGGDVWLQLGHPPVIFNTDIWDIPGEPCDNWQVEPTPRWLHGSWVFAAVASAEPWNEHGSPRRWGSASLRIDLDAGTAALALTPRRTRKCRLAVFGRIKNHASLKLEPAAYGYADEDGQFLNLECDVKGAHGSVERLYVRSEGSLIADGDMAAFVVLRPLAQVAAGLPAAKGLTCSPSAPRCEPPFICQLTVSYVPAPQRNTGQFLCNAGAR